MISDDGTMDLIPNLMPQVHKSEVEAVVDDFCATCSEDTVHGERFALTHERVLKLAFDLNEGQCQRVNDCYASEMNRRREAGRNTASSRPLRPHPDVDESYFANATLLL